MYFYHTYFYILIFCPFLFPNNETVHTHHTRCWCVIKTPHWFVLAHCELILLMILGFCFIMNNYITMFLSLDANAVIRNSLKRGKYV